MDRTPKNVVAGLIFIAFGMAFAIAAQGYGLGTARAMGPGLFPSVLGWILVVLGGIIVAEGFLRADETPLGAIPWRGAVLILAAVLFFGFTVRGLGFVPALFVTVLLSAFASRRTGPVAALVLAAGLTAACFLIFVVGLGLPLQPFGPWLAF